MLYSVAEENQTCAEFSSQSKGYQFSKRIGSTTYEATAYSSKNATENIDDKIYRLIKREVSDREVVVH